MIWYTVVNILISEAFFFIFRRVATRDNFITVAIATFMIGTYIMLASFLGIAIPVVKAHNSGSDITVLDALGLFIIAAYNFFRGTDQIQKINKAMGNA